MLSQYDGIYYCLSTDEKPVSKVIPNGRWLFELDTKKIYVFDKENQTWREWGA